MWRLNPIVEQDMDTKLFWETVKTIMGEGLSEGRDFREQIEEEFLKASARQDRGRVEQLINSISLVQHLTLEKFKEELSATPSPSVALHRTAQWGNSAAPETRMGTYLVDDLRPIIADSYEKLMIPEAVALTGECLVYHIPVEQQSIRKAIVVMPTLCNLVGYPVPYPLRTLYADPDIFCHECVLIFHTLEKFISEEVEDFLAD